MEITPLEHWISYRLGTSGQRLTRNRIESHQVRKLRETIRWARAHSSFYREHLAGKTEDNLSSPGDLTRFPFTTAEDLRQNPLRFLCVSQSEVKRVVTLQTSGTTGDPKRIHFTAEDQELTVDFFHHGMSTLVGPGDRVLILLPGHLPGSVGDLLVRGLERLGAVGVPHGFVQDVSQTLEVMARERVDALVGTPTQVLALARQGNGDGAPRSVLLSTDHVPDAITRELQRRWGCEVFTHYGMTEMGFGGGVECRAHCGYHLRELDLYFEIIDPQTGDPVSAGELGEVVFTTLTRHGMPLIRYRTGDLSRFLPDPCPCGTVLRSTERVRGRIDGQIQLPEGGLLTMADLDEALFPIEALLDFRAAITREGEKDRLHIEAYIKGDLREELAEAVRGAVQSIPAVRAGSERGLLLLSADVGAGGAAPPRGTAKRAIDDRRSGVDCPECSQFPA